VAGLTWIGSDIWYGARRDMFMRLLRDSGLSAGDHRAHGRPAFAGRRARRADLRPALDHHARARQIISGKLGSAALQVLVYLSALAPCLAFTYLLRGLAC